MNVENAILSEEYQQANKTHSEAFKAYVLVRDAYRAGKLTDQKFIAAQKEYFAALAVWELAYEKERN
tara:strand:- start:870 stop:1070 length:201 start_codon:yes stop_codon:yes gene_type:complete